MTKELDLLNGIAEKLEELSAHLTENTSLFDTIGADNYPFELTIEDMAEEFRHMAERAKIAQEQRNYKRGLLAVVNALESTDTKLDYLEGYLKALKDTGQKNHFMYEYANELYEELCEGVR